MKHFLIAAALFGIMPAHAQEAEPKVHPQILAYAEQRDTVLGQIRFVYAAVGCGVLWGDGAFQFKVIALQSLDRPAIELSLADPKLNALDVINTAHKMADVAASEGVKKAAEPGKCEWFVEHQDVVNDLRESVGAQ